MACKFLSLMLPNKVGDLPDPLVDIFCWEGSWVAAPAMWKLLVKACAELASRNPWHAATCLRAAGLCVQSVDLGDVSGPCTDEFLCGSCATWWPSKGSLAQHRRRAHGDDALALAARSVAIGTVCPACGIDFFSRIRVCRHLKWGAAACREALLEGSLPVECPEDVGAADARDRALRTARRHVGLSAVAGPWVRRGG
jgi:hypothetical protein